MPQHSLDLNAAGTLVGLLDRLDRHGVTLPAINQHRALTAALVVPGEPEVPADILDMSPDELHALAREIATARAINSSPDKHLLRAVVALRSPLDAALTAALRASASEVVAQLRPAFDEAADGLRAALAAGVRADDTLETLFQAPGPRRSAWLAAKEHAKVLDDIFTTRQQLSTVAKVPPVPDPVTTADRVAAASGAGRGTGVNWSAVVIRPAARRSLAPYDPAAPWVRWLAVAEDLELVDPAELDGFNGLSSANPAAARRLLDEANRRAAAEA